MTSRVVKTETDRKMLYRFIATRPLPFSVSITKGAKRSNEQNRLSHMWFKEAADQLGDRSADDVRAYCKLVFGVPILRNEDDGFRIKYDRIVRPLRYEDKMAMMVEPFDMPITRLMSVDQERRFLDAIFKHFTELGVVLTDPDPLSPGPSALSASARAA